ncbi:hypothetical protein A3E97_00280 [Candidatus Uhrbacteria bacterium RIFCSPHIGHO2_12_FULL_47_12]|uniref:Ribbon-helix-helix protein CopG domain-containing protein n=1 Tax=Candidatus Uhrbacteria bacterium RIFCSPLOWO2_02_FULL_48_18 TaxID=1802408 RepID=A0A1F7V8T3_9BACT|nr:MAG: hypothetical protein A3E97_00280 [Candidatus Uhrbacteria bacterium RIFCSPHIGHO2_12_FULL_47_12]OGL81769.1 MAG: hypothetical protein A3B20_01595 [Candidatus Uhrbacteria bacterium RIFCSPLOWO2_01_FULL_47_17]OGL86932.1 MAG: hypothetical protein A3I41_03185 [Candidatus Uhrbacteria bacterium RIFCSPLOWO2_02_FULL_48_18]OGL94331.1 MAG: hypothetical protein A3H12_05035 [Candidatus Uhrbacteria bacterium RIFCSPLOWO2_12_FULL_47_9]
MPTAKYRIHVSVPRDVEMALQRLAKRDDVPCASKALELIKAALELEEDQVWNRLAIKRDTKKAKFVSHEKVWG